MADFGEDEEIDAEAELKPRVAYPSLRSKCFKGILELYGWYIVLTTLLIFFLYKKYIAPILESIAAKKELEERKKYDDNVQAAYEQRIRAARERIQAQYEADAARELERQKRKAEEALQRAIREHGREGETAAQARMTPSNSRSVTSAKGFDAMTFVMNKINSTPVVVFSKSWCPSCRKAKQALSTFRISTEFYEIVELDKMENSGRIEDALLSISGRRTVPHVFIGGRCIGGADETLNALRDGRLKRMLDDTGVTS
ncbi:unnamed protein product [Toxocara canis]|uniref:Glutaredoxin domain-containing protein n=1 Tax=Toxocara canis TaxID=6265 RepID=A0A183V9H1_TOXCA|nr:unnamed protein product [Toxocara canis]